MMKIRDRVKAFKRVKASELAPNPKNWRRHPPAQQDANLLQKQPRGKIKRKAATLTR